MSSGVRSFNARMGPVARIAAVLAVLGAIVFLVSMRGLGNAIMTPSAKQAKKEVNDQIKRVAADYALGLDGQVKQFNGRSVFFVPSPPVPAPPPVPPEVKKDPGPPPPPPPPSSYGGPKLIAMINGIAWFEDGKKMAAGDPLKEKIRVKKINPPWGATVEYDGMDFEVGLFSADNVVYPPPKKEEPKTAAAETAKASPAKETHASDVQVGDKPEPPKPDSPIVEPPKPEVPPASKPDQPEAPKPEQPKTDKPDSPGSPEGQIEKPT